MMNTISSRDFAGRVAEVKQWASRGPVFITHRGASSHVLMNIEEYRRLTGTAQSLADALAMKDGEDIPFDPPKAGIRLRSPEWAGDDVSA